VPETIDGLPLHALVVHFTVVLLPIAALGSLLTALWPAVRRRFGWLTVAAAAVATALVPVSTISGENLEAGLGGGNPLIDRHQQLADLMIWWSLGLFVAVTALMLIHTAGERRAKSADFDADGGGGDVATATRTKSSAGLTVGLVVAMVATVGLAVGTGVHIYRVGDAGARTVWQDVGENLK
jgi:hypothetical protein